MDKSENEVSIFHLNHVLPTRKHPEKPHRLQRSTMSEAQRRQRKHQNPQTRIYESIENVSLEAAPLMDPVYFVNIQKIIGYVNYLPGDRA